MLVSTKKLAAAIRNLRKRNSLLAQLSNSSKNDSLYIYKTMMAFWLGANEKLCIIINNHHYFPYAYINYFCLLYLDKQISLLPEDSALKKELVAVQGNILQFYNRRYYLLERDPNYLFEQFTYFIEKLTENNTFTKHEKTQLQIIKKHCLVELNRSNFRGLDLLKLSDPTENVACRKNSYFNWFAPRISAMILANRLITMNFDLNYFYYSPLETDIHYSVRNIYLPAQDGMYLNGLYIKTRYGDKKRLVLLAVGHFQAEQHYISRGISEYHQIFGCDRFLVVTYL